MKLIRGKNAKVGDILVATSEMSFFIEEGAIWVKIGNDEYLGIWNNIEKGKYDIPWYGDVYDFLLLDHDPELAKQLREEVGL